MYKSTFIGRHRCTDNMKNNPMPTKLQKPIGRDLDMRASEYAIRYLDAKHELETWRRDDRNVDYDKLKLKVRRMRSISIGLMEGKSMKKAKNLQKKK